MKIIKEVSIMEEMPKMAKKANIVLAQLSWKGRS